MRTGIHRRIAFMVVMCLLYCLPGCSKNVSVKELVAHRSKYHNKQVVVTGCASDVLEKVSRNDNIYHTFMLVNHGKRVRVFAFGSANVKDGMHVRVKGIYHKLKRVGYAVFRNEIDATDGYTKAL